MSKLRINGAVMLCALLSLVLAMVLGACGDADTPTASSTSAAVATTAAAMTSAAATTSAAMTSAATTSAAMTSAAATAGATAGTSGGSSSIDTTKFNVTAPANLKAGPGIDTANKIIKVGAIDALSGPVAVGGKPLERGSEIYFKALNDNGGIGGYKVQVVPGDSQYAPQLAVQQYSKIAPDVALFTQIMGAPSAAAIKDQAESDKVLFQAATSDSSVLSYKYGYLDTVPYPLETINAIDYTVNQAGKKGGKFAIVYQDDAYGQDCLKGYKAAVQGMSLQDVGQIPFNVTDKDFTAQATQLKNSGADVVYMASQPAQTAAIMGAATQLGFQPQWVLGSSAFTSQLLATPLKPVLLKSLYVAYGVTWGDPTSPNEATKIAAVAKYAPDQKPDNYFSAGWVYGIVAANILAKAMANGDMTRDGLLAAFQSLTNVDVGLGPTQYTLSYGATANNRVPFRSSEMFKIVDISTDAPAGYTPITKPFTSDVAKNYKFS